MKWMLYGANGYTGELCAQRAVERGLHPVLAGRREEAIRPLAERLGLEWKVFSLERAADELAGFQAVLLCAGPFSATSAPVVAACLKNRAHYLDITGEIAVFEACHAQSEAARAAGIVLLPGVGFDIVPSDCLAASVAQALPGATHLELALAAGGRPSRGTAKTIIENINRGGMIRRDGQLVRVRTAWKTLDVPFRDHKRRCVSVPIADVATAFYSTGVPNITAYQALPRPLIRAFKWSRPLLPVAGLRPVQRFLKARVDRQPRGPDLDARKRVRAELWCRVRDAAGHEVQGTLETPDGYSLTVEAALECTRRLLEGKTPPGMHTPSTAFGPRFVTELEGCDLRISG